MRRRNMLFGATAVLLVTTSARETEAALTDGDLFKGIDKLLAVLNPIKDILDNGFTDLLKGVNIEDPAGTYLLALERNLRSFLRQISTFVGTINGALEVLGLEFPDEITETLGKSRRFFSTKMMRRLRRGLRASVAAQEKVQSAGDFRLQQVQVMRTLNNLAAGFPTVALQAANELQALQSDAIADLTSIINTQHREASEEKARLLAEEESALDFTERFMAPGIKVLEDDIPAGAPPVIQGQN